MKYLFDNWDKIAGVVRSSTRILLLLDYDGTTFPIQRSPERARLDEETRTLLCELSGTPKITLGIISGRSIDDICTMVGLDRLIYTGNHGLEILLPGKPVKRLYTEKEVQLTNSVLKELKKSVAGIKGVRIEDKGPIITLHYRTAPPGTGERLLEMAEGIVSKNPGLAVRRGKMVIEITTDKSFDKGETVKWLLDNLFPGGKPVVVFVGDDLSDEDVFAILGQDDVSVYVGRRPGPANLSAVFYMKDSAETRQFLYRLHHLLMSGSG